MSAAAKAPTTFRPPEDLQRAFTRYAEESTEGNISAAVCELIVAGLRVKRGEAKELAAPKKELRVALLGLYPEWSGKTVPDFGKPVKVSLKDGRDPISLILERRAK